MMAVHGYYDGAAFQPFEKMELRKNQRVIITILDDIADNARTIDEERVKKIKQMRGCISQYAKPDVEEAMMEEEEAWARAVAEKYGDFRC